MSDDVLNIANDVVTLAKAKGASAADCMVVDTRDTSLSIRNGTIEKLEQAEAREVGVRVFVGQSSAIMSGSVLSKDALERLVERAIDMAKLAPPDPHAGLADPSQLETTFRDLDLASDEVVTSEDLLDRARRAEEAALAVRGVSKSNGAGASSYDGWSGLYASNGFSRASRRTSFGVSASVIAGEGTAMERDYDGHGAVYFSDLEPSEKIGLTAGERAVKRLNPRKLSSQKVPVMFDRRVATTIIGHLLAAINGALIARGTSFLKGDLGKDLFQSGVTIVDDPLRLRGTGSRSSDGEGLPVRRAHLIDKGVLTQWILDLRSARQLHLSPTGQGSRGLSSQPTPSTSNVHMEAGSRSPTEMMKDLGKGFLVTEFIGSSINMVTGDYSRGASGFWFENGEIAYPVSEVTIAGNLRDMFKACEPASDLIWRGSVNSPSCYLGELTVAGR